MAVSVADEESRSEREAWRRARQLATILDVNRRLALGPQLGDVLARITEEAARLIGADIARLLLVEDGGLTLAARFGPHGRSRLGQRLPLAGSLNGLVVRDNRPLISDDLTADPRAEPTRRRRARAIGFRSWMGVPLRGRERVVGTLTLLARDAGHFTDDDVHLLEAFADQAAIAIENARLFEREQQRRRQLEAVRRVAANLTRELDLPALLQLIVDQAVELPGAICGAVLLWDEHSQTLVPRAWQGYGPWIEGLRLRLGESGAGAAALQRRGIVVNDYRASPYVHPLFVEHTEIVAILVEPILYQDRLVGTITVCRDQHGGPFVGPDAEMLRLFADEAAIAIEHARLFEQAAALEALRELARLKSEFLSTASHELRTPLSIIYGFSELLSRRAETLLPAQVAEMAGEIHGGARTLARLVDDLVEAAHLEQGKLRLDRRQVDVAILLNELAATFRARPGGERIVAELPAELEADVDPRRLGQVVGNLLANALQHAPDGPVILRARHEEAWFRVEVADHGPGVPHDEQPRVWEKFYRGAAARLSAQRSSGLGLAMVEHLVGLHGGCVGLASTPGHGATFWLTIPLTK